MADYFEIRRCRHWWNIIERTNTPHKRRLGNVSVREKTIQRRHL